MSATSNIGTRDGKRLIRGRVYYIIDVDTNILRCKYEGVIDLTRHPHHKGFLQFTTGKAIHPDSIEKRVYADIEQAKQVVMKELDKRAEACRITIESQKIYETILLEQRFRISKMKPYKPKKVAAK